ncbi:glycoside hydrolase family 99-like domain-containing protein [Flavitalea sp.]|nr:glycoside hydrolase family 99-like domain-containing protein [Flavitalea sp.]
MKKHFIFIAALLVTFTACVKKADNPTAEENILNYEIQEVPVVNDFTVGAFYYNFGTFNANITEVPVAGKYGMPNGLVPPAVMRTHIEQAGRGGIDYFLFQFRSVSRDLNNFRSDSTVVKSFLDVNTANMKFALAYNFASATYGISAAAPLENDAVKLEQFFQDILKMAPLLGNANYIKVNDKVLLYIVNAQTLFSSNNSAIYTTLRNRLSALGFQLYIVGMQDRWTPPARYPFRYQNGVDAVYHQSFSSQLNDWDRWNLLPQAMDQNWKYSRQWFADNIKVDYVPNITPAYNWKITQPASSNPNYLRNDSGEIYKKLCNVAKMNASPTTRLILIDSWNKWDEDMQLEPANSYGELYLKITRQQFKKQ